MKKLIFVSIFFVLSFVINSQNFTWVNGTNAIGTAGNYGTLNVPSPSNNPGQRHGCAQWVDVNGDLWFFGGEAPSAQWRNDLWKYTVATDEWTWMNGSNTINTQGVYGTQGVSAPSNQPGAREFATSWTDAAGNFWMFGGEGPNFTPNLTLVRFADLWKYNPTTNEWTWMKGYNTPDQSGVYGTLGVPAPTNLPGSRGKSVGFADATGNLWLFGGTGQTTSSLVGRLNDLWRYNIANNEWTWINGNTTLSPYGVYGALSVPATSNTPGGREFPASWLDASGNFWVFGGQGRDTATAGFNFGLLNDLWKYDPVANTWALIAGPTTINAFATYGTLETPDPANRPGSRLASACWVDGSGNFWLFGGRGYCLTSFPGKLNDFWRYNPTTNQWTWMKGSNLVDQNGTYGTQGVAAVPNVPGGRDFSVYWTDQTGKFWLFGGEGFDASSSTDGHMNDLWSYKTPCNPDTITATPANSVCSGANLTLTAVNGGPTTLWYDSPTSTTTLSGGAYFSLPTLTATGASTTFTYYAEANSCTTSPRPSITITVNPLPIISAVGDKTIMCYYSPITFTASGANSYTWNTNPPAQNPTVTVTPSGGVHGAILTYTVTGTDLNNCTAVATATVKALGCIGIQEIDKISMYNHSLYPNPSKGEFTIKTDVNLEGGKLSIINALGEKVYSQSLNSEDSTIKVDLIKGVYFYVISDKNKAQSSGKLIIE